MKKNGIALLSILVIVTLIAFIAVSQSAKAITPYERTLGSNTGFIPGTKTLSISSTAAVKCPPLPDGAHEVWGVCVNAFNYGDSTVSTGSAELFVATLTPSLIGDKIISSNPDIYFRCRGGDTVATITLQYK